MATRAQEIDTIGDVLAAVGVDRFYKQDFPLKYVANTIGIRWQGDNSDGLTGAHFLIENTYQIVYFGDSERDCLDKSETISAIINDKIDMKLKIRDLDEYITLRSFSMTPTFKTETDGVYAISAILTVESNRNRILPEQVMLNNFNFGINEGGN